MLKYFVYYSASNHFESAVSKLSQTHGNSWIILEMIVAWLLTDSLFEQPRFKIEATAT